MRYLKLLSRKLKYVYFVRIYPAPRPDAQLAAFTNPGIRCDRFGGPCGELLSVEPEPARLLEQCLQVHHGQALALAEDAGKDRFAATGISQIYNPLGDFQSRKKPVILQVLGVPSKTDGGATAPRE
jgi:hypothetical protein